MTNIFKTIWHIPCTTGEPIISAKYRCSRKTSRLKEKFSIQDQIISIFMILKTQENKRNLVPILHTKIGYKIEGTQKHKKIGVKSLEKILRPAITYHHNHNNLGKSHINIGYRFLTSHNLKLGEKEKGDFIEFYGV